MSIFEGSPFTEAAAQTVSVRVICWKTGPQLSVPGGQILLFPCGAPIPFPGAVCQHLCSAAHANCYHKFSFRRILLLLCRGSCADLSFTNVKKKRAAPSDFQKLLLPSPGASRSLSHSWFVEWLRFPPEGDTDGCAAISPHVAYLTVESLVGSQHSALSPAFCCCLTTNFSMAAPAGSHFLRLPSL